MDKETIKTIIADFHTRGIPDFIEREILLFCRYLLANI